MKITRLIKESEFYLKKLLALGCSYKSEHAVTETGTHYERITIFDKKQCLMAIFHCEEEIRGFCQALTYISICERNKNLETINPHL